MLQCIYMDALYGSNMGTILNTLGTVLQRSKGLETTDLTRMKRSKA